MARKSEYSDFYFSYNKLRCNKFVWGYLFKKFLKIISKTLDIIRIMCYIVFKDLIMRSFDSHYKHFLLINNIEGNITSNNVGAFLQSKKERFDKLELELSSQKEKKLKYKEVEKILSEYSQRKYSKRRFAYYLEKGLMPDIEKSSFNQGLYDTIHICSFLIIDQLLEVLGIEDIKRNIESFHLITETVSAEEIFSFFKTAYFETNKKTNYDLKEIEILLMKYSKSFEEFFIKNNYTDDMINIYIKKTVDFFHRLKHLAYLIYFKEINNIELNSSQEVKEVIL